MDPGWAEAQYGASFWIKHRKNIDPHMENARTLTLTWSTHDASWELMMHHELSLCIMSTHDSWCIMSTHEASWVLMMHHEYSWFIMITHDASWVHPGIQEHPGSPSRNHKNIQGTLARPPLTFCQCATVCVSDFSRNSQIMNLRSFSSNKALAAEGFLLVIYRIAFVHQDFPSPPGYLT